MPIIQTQISAGVQPSGTLNITINDTYDVSNYASAVVSVPNPSTGTKTITNNGTFNVTDYASASVNVPTTAPDHYIKKEKQSTYNPFDGGYIYKLVNSSSIISLNGISYVDDNALTYAYYGNTAISGNLDLSELKYINGEKGLYYTFSGCTGITSVDLSGLIKGKGTRTCQYMFSNCTNLTSVDMSNFVSLNSNASTTETYTLANMFQNCTSLESVDLSSLETINSRYGCYAMFSGCSNLKTVKLNSLKEICAQYSCYNMFYDCTSLESIDLSNLEYISHYNSDSQNNGTNKCAYMFYGCTSLKNVDLSKLKLIFSTNNSASYMFYGCTSLENISFPSLYSAKCLNSIFSGCTNLKSIDLGKVVYLNADQVAQSMCANCTNLESINLSSLYSISTNNTFRYAFQNCTSLKTLSFNSLLEPWSSYPSITTFNNMLQGCSDVTVHFPSNLQSTIGTWNDTINGFGGTNTTVLFDLPVVTRVDLSIVTDITSYYELSNTGFRNIESIDISNLRKITGNNALCSLASFSPNVLNPEISFDSLFNISSYYCFQYIIGSDTSSGNNCTFKFPALKEINNITSLNKMIYNKDGCTLHFPSNLDPQTGSTVISSLETYPDFGGTNTTILYDLPSTKPLIGVDTNTYDRNPKYDTTSVLAWRIGDDWSTLYYTLGTTDPQVGDMIYSDSACTTVVTTIDSIA